MRDILKYKIYHLPVKSILNYEGCLHHISKKILNDDFMTTATAWKKTQAQRYACFSKYPYSFRLFS